MRKRKQKGDKSLTTRQRIKTLKRTWRQRAPTNPCPWERPQKVPKAKVNNGGRKTAGTQPQSQPQVKGWTEEERVLAVSGTTVAREEATPHPPPKGELWIHQSMRRRPQRRLSRFQRGKHVLLLIAVTSTRFGEQCRGDFGATWFTLKAFGSLQRTIDLSGPHEGPEDQWGPARSLGEQWGSVGSWGMGSVRLGPCKSPWAAYLLYFHQGRPGKTGRHPGMERDVVVEPPGAIPPTLGTLT